MEIRYTSAGRCVAVSLRDLDVLAEKFLSTGGFIGHGYPFEVFVALEADKFLRRVEEARDPVRKLTNSLIKEGSCIGRN